ncbi:MAG TPA: hypothetical protein VJ728_08745, partial [Candidatus Binataceae bacterium]|nr:hypothetical protein [Candidatus Binataceae bacterium]
REHPEIRWRLGGSDIERMAVLQRRMLNEAAAAVSTGGVLVYSVCSIAPEEGPEAIADFLTNNPDFEIDRSAIGKEFDGLIDHRGYIQTRPDRHGLDGFFAARLRRRN